MLISSNQANNFLLPEYYDHERTEPDVQSESIEYVVHDSNILKLPSMSAIKLRLSRAEGYETKSSARRWQYMEIDVIDKISSVLSEFRQVILSFFGIRNPDKSCAVAKLKHVKRYYRLNFSTEQYSNVFKFGEANLSSLILKISVQNCTSKGMDRSFFICERGSTIPTLDPSLPCVREAARRKNVRLGDEGSQLVLAEYNACGPMISL